ncbi:MAG: glycoside hydrolase N-terminal domain-containing protein [Luteolibacter sp.]
MLKKLPILVCLFICTWKPLQAADNAQTLWYRQAASTWVEALPLGNGRLGAMVFGGVESERLQLNEDTLWGGGPYDPARPGAKEAIAEARQLVFAGKASEATKVINDRGMASPKKQMPYQTLGDLKLEFPASGGEVADYRRPLDLETVTATTTFTVNGVTFTREVFADDHNIFYVDVYSKMTSTGLNSWKGVGGDKVHLTPEGYELWAAELAPVLKRLLAN